MSSADELLPDDELSPDPLYLSALSELKWIVVAWSVNFAWVIGFSVFNGDGKAGGNDPVDDSSPSLVLGMPSWVFWGVMLPWILATLFTAWFALTQIKDHPLESTPAGERGNG